MNFLLAESNLGPDELKWLATSVGALVALSALAYYTLASIKTYRELHKPPPSPTPMPLPVIVEKSLAEKFVDHPTFERHEQYVHQQFHKCHNDLNDVKLAGETGRKEIEDLIREQNAQVSIRSKNLHERINDVMKGVARIEGRLEKL